MASIPCWLFAIFIIICHRVSIHSNYANTFFAENKDIRGEREGFRGLWKRVKPMEKPEEVCRFRFYDVSIDGLGGIQGIPFDIRDSMFNPPSSHPFPNPNDLPSLSRPDQPPLSADFLVCFPSLDG
jgi:hypothetical protein